MTSGRWQQIEAIFGQAVELPLDERVAWVEKECAGDSEIRREVLSLLASDEGRSTAWLEGQVRAAVELEAVAAPVLPQTIGTWTVVRELGLGGMGTVYLANRSGDFQQQVAIKVVRPGLDTDFILRRFRRERQILARLRHPNIARLLDGGTAEDGSPYMVMEYVEGEWLTHYAVSHNLSVNDRLRLFVSVCEAVDFAHRNFVVHRDLKPGNILVDQTGTPRLLDFGISKLLQSEEGDLTETVGMMTPIYASPEQVVGDPITIATDVYSLGVLLYELLVGTNPHRVERHTPLALERAICIEDTIFPSAAAPDRALARRLTGDLDNIVLRAMHKEPERRYPSAAAMAADLEAYLTYRPVSARPDSLSYRLSKFLRRNRLQVAVATVFFGGLTAAAAVALYEARVAASRFQQVRHLATTFLFDLEANARTLPGSVRLRELITKTGLEYLDQLAASAASDVSLKRELAEAYQRIGDVQGGSRNSNLGQPAAARASYHRADTLYTEVLRQNPTDRKAQLGLLRTLHYAGALQLDGNDPVTARKTFERALSLLQPAGDLDFDLAAQTAHLDLALLLRRAGEQQEALRHTKEALLRGERIAAARPNDNGVLLDVANSYSQLASGIRLGGDPKTALGYYEKARDLREKLLARNPGDPNTRHELMLVYGHVGDTLGNPGFENLGDTAGALISYRKMEALAKTLYEADAADSRATLDYGIALLRVGSTLPDPAERAEVLLRSVQLTAQVLSKTPKNYNALTHRAWAEELLGDAELASGKPAEAARRYQAAQASSRGILENNPVDVGGVRRYLGAGRKLAEIRAREGKRAEVESIIAAMAAVVVPAEKAPPKNVGLRVTIPRFQFGAASAFAILKLPQARHYAELAMQNWQALQSQPGFSTAAKNEMEATARLLSSLGGPQ